MLLFDIFLLNYLLWLLKCFFNCFNCLWWFHILFGPTFIHICKSWTSFDFIYLFSQNCRFRFEHKIRFVMRMSYSTKFLIPSSIIFKVLWDNLIFLVQIILMNLFWQVIVMVENVHVFLFFSETIQKLCFMFLLHYYYYYNY